MIKKYLAICIGLGSCIASASQHQITRLVEIKNASDQKLTSYFRDSKGINNHHELSSEKRVTVETDHEIVLKWNAQNQQYILPLTDDKTRVTIFPALGLCIKGKEKSLTKQVWLGPDLKNRYKSSSSSDSSSSEENQS
jgi:hypothetical protein